MITTVEEYLHVLKTELRGSDAALIRDALSDAREHLSTALAAAREDQPNVKEAEGLAAIVEEFGTPQETALAYLEIERRLPVQERRPTHPRSPLRALLSVYSDTRTWNALLYMLIAFVTGTVYFVWILAGTAFSGLFALFVFGLPFVLAFLLSIHALVLGEGRLVEALLGVRMPRRRLFYPEQPEWRAQLMALLTDERTWCALLYVGLHFVLGCLYLLLAVAAVGFSFAFVSVPISQEWLGVGAISLGGSPQFLPRWSYPLLVLGGLLLWTVFLHVVRAVERLHGRLAKTLLVGE